MQEGGMTHEMGGGMKGWLEVKLRWIGCVCIQSKSETLDGPSNYHQQAPDMSRTRTISIVEMIDILTEGLLMHLVIVHSR